MEGEKGTRRGREGGVIGLRDRGKRRKGRKERVKRRRIAKFASQ